MPTPDDHPFAPLVKAEYVNLTTFRKNGERKTTPIWLAVEEGKAYVWSQRDTWKIRRLRNDPKVELTPCNVNGKKNLGPTLAGKARILQAGEEATAKYAFKRKYGIKFMAGEFFGRHKPGSDHVYVEIEPG